MGADSWTFQVEGDNDECLPLEFVWNCSGHFPRGRYYPSMSIRVEDNDYFFNLEQLGKFMEMMIEVFKNYFHSCFSEAYDEP